MAEKKLLVTQKDDRYLYDDTLMLEPQSIGIINHEMRMKIISLLAKRPMYPAEIARELGVHEQKVYYHIKQLSNAGVITEKDRREIRGTVAKRYTAEFTNFSVSLSENLRSLTVSKRPDKKLESFLNPFIVDEKATFKIVVGSPDPHGPHKARARDGHYAIDLALFLGRLSSLSKDFQANLDVDTDIERDPKDMIIVGGPVTNLVTGKINEFLPAKFADSEPWGIVAKKAYSEDTTGIIARIPNPFNPDTMLLILAGIKVTGTKSAVLALTRHTNLILDKFSGQKSFYAIVQGFDLDGDGRIDDIELLE